MLHQHRSSKRPVAFLAALLLGVIAAASAQYVEPTFYGEPTYYSPEPVPAYYSPEPVPVYYSPEPVAPAVYYYSSPAPVTPYGEPVAPTPYYYAPPPVSPVTPYGEPVAPTPYYYAPPVAPVTPYGEPVAPTPYYYIPPVAPTTPYGSPAPVAPAPYYYFTPTAPVTPYGSPAPVAPAPYYYLTPTAPTTPYGSPAPVAPAYYYVAPAPVTPYAAPSTCPPCPTCDTPVTASPTPSALAITAPVTPSTEGTCYCPYDADWATWAIDDSSCRSTLYSKCKTDARLSCSWLDAYFSSNATSHNDFSRQHDADIEAYLYNDCPPASPCSCASLEFTSKDSPASTFQCCKALKVYAKVPFSGLVAKDVDAYCEAGSAKAGSRVSSWVKHALWHSDCSVASSSVYTYKKAGDSTAASVSADKAAAAPKSRAASTEKRSTILAATFGAIGGVGLAAAAAAGWIAYKKSNPRYSMV